MSNTCELSDGEWVDISRACSDLSIGRATLHRMKDRGLLQPGMHWLRITPGKSSRILWNPLSIRKAMAGWSMAPQRDDDHSSASAIHTAEAAA
jgi:hypothetical protein